MLLYNAPDGTPSTIDSASNNKQMQSFLYLKKAIIEAQRERFFMPLATSNVSQPEHFGKTVKMHVYVPILSDLNVNDQGIDAQGAATANGNLYGSSRDIGTIKAKLPELSEQGGRVNRVGFTRLERSGSLHEYGFFFEFTKDSIQFDSDAQLMSHLSRELVNAAHEISEATLQMDLLAFAGVHVFAGNAQDMDEITGEGATPSVVNYANLQRVTRLLTANRTPLHTKMVTGTRNVDTATIPAARIAYIGPDVSPLIKTIKDPFNNPAFIPAQKYAAGTSLVHGEIGSIDQLRFVEVPDMLHWAGAGADVDQNPGYLEDSGKYNVYPILIVGSESFNTIAFQSNGKTVKFNVITKMPGEQSADRSEPYGKLGFSSIRWYYGFLGLRPERVAVVYTVAPV